MHCVVNSFALDNANTASVRADSDSNTSVVALGCEVCIP